MTTRKQDEDFLADMIPTNLLDLSVEWISKNLAPEEVFTEADLSAWAELNDYVLKEAE